MVQLADTAVQYYRSIDWLHAPTTTTEKLYKYIDNKRSNVLFSSHSRFDRTSVTIIVVNVCTPFTFTRLPNVHTSFYFSHTHTHIYAYNYNIMSFASVGENIWLHMRLLTYRVVSKCLLKQFNNFFGRWRNR